MFVPFVFMNLPCSLFVAFFMTLIIVRQCSSQQGRANIPLPPRITNVPRTEQSYKVGEQSFLTCEADGKPQPVYEWKKEEKRLDVDNVRIKWQQPDSSGTILIPEPVGSDEGTYQCFARNEWGAAFGTKITFKKAVLDHFPSLKQPKIHSPFIGTPLILTCDPPKSYPEGLVYWGENRPGSKLKPIENTDRISSDYKGYLYFSNVQLEDYQQGYPYICIVQNMALRSLVQGDDKAIHPRNVSGQPKYEAPQLMWSSSPRTIAIRSQVIKMKCIFSGYPTPKVTWSRLDGSISETAEQTSFGQEIIIRNVQFEDEGSYRCSATNSKDRSPVSKDFQLIVESIPYWRQDRPPDGVNVAEDDPAEISCLADGRPRPSVSWFINGRPIEEVEPDRRRTVNNQMISYSSVTKADIQVIQCNASNEHGYIIANSYINVLAEPPSFIKAPKAIVKVVEGEDVTLACQAFGAPKPIISWRHETAASPQQSVDIFQNKRSQQQSSGDLLIKMVTKNDSGIYECIPSNKFGSEYAKSQLIVRERTVISKHPKDQTVNVLTNVVFRCSAKTDPSETSNLAIEWHQNGERLDMSHHPRMEHDKNDDSMIIRGVTVSDTANYTCHASNGVDQSEAMAQLVVKDRPDPPNVWLENNCASNKAEVVWSPGSENNDKTIEYVIYYNTSHDPPDKFHVARRVPVQSASRSTVVSLLPWTSYSFHATARNGVGESRRSALTSELINCTTSSAKPFRHPDKVCTSSRGENELVIVWQPIEPMEHNGENFHYLVGYKRDDMMNAIVEEIKNWRTSEIVITNQPTFAQYEIYVKSINIIGQAPVALLRRRFGYSGQGTPLNRPEDFRLESCNSSSARFLWRATNENPNEVKGFFLGYRIKFWKTENPKIVRYEDVLLKSVDECSLIDEEGWRRKRDTKKDEVVKGHTDKLWPFSDITAGVMVLNGAYRTGPISTTSQFTTPEGVPDAASKFEVSERGSNHLVVRWQPPEETNGILTGYMLEFEEAPSGAVLVKTEVEPGKREKKITGLKDDTSYVVRIRATTSAGKGEETDLEEKTRTSSVPDKPEVRAIETGDDFAVVSWQTTSGKNVDDKNPGSEYFVEYRPEGSKEWLRTANDTDHNSVNVTDLDRGINYEVRVVAFNDDRKQSQSEIHVVTFGPKVEPVRSKMSDSLLYILLIASLLLLVIVAILCIFCFAACSKADEYLVNEKEKKLGCAAGKNNEADFEEYIRPQGPLLTRSHHSVNSISGKKPVESDVDSLGEYGDPDPSKFNEDGSFIGQYGNKKTTGSENPPPAAYSTFI